MNPKDRAGRQAALTRLAVATREKLPDSKEDRDAFMSVFLSDLEHFSTDTFVRACRHLETVVAWFPKKAELYDACQAIARRKQLERKPSLALPPGDKPVDPEKVKQLRQHVLSLVRKKGMGA